MAAVKNDETNNFANETSTRIEVKTDKKMPENYKNKPPRKARDSNGNEDDFDETDESRRNENEAFSEEIEGKEESELDAAKNEAQENYDRLLRLTAEFENYKKRTTRELSDFKKFANENLVKEILPIIDNLERAIEAFKTNADAKDCLSEGVDLTLKEMMKVFERFSIQPIEAVGETFDPCFHQAVMQEETDDQPENTVIRELQKGYMMHDRLIRPAMVIVSASKSAKSGINSEDCECSD